MGLVQGPPKAELIRPARVNVISASNVNNKGESTSSIQTAEDQYAPDPIADAQQAQEDAHEARMQRLASLPQQKKPEQIVSPPQQQPEVVAAPIEEVTPDPTPDEAPDPEVAPEAEEKDMMLAQAYIELEKIMLQAKLVQDEYNALAKEMVEYYGEGFTFYDDDTKAVYRCENNFNSKEVVFKTVGVNKYEITATRREQYGEKQGSLSIKVAKELGYTQV